MRAKTINEIDNFERGIDPKVAMGTGKILEVRKILGTIYNQKYNSYVYKIQSLNHIEVFYSQLVKRDMPEVFKNNKWIIKYVEKDSYFARGESQEIRSFSHSLGKRDSWNIYEVKFNLHDNPEKMNFIDQYSFELPQTLDKYEEMTKIVVDALNKQYGKVGGFELIEKRTENES